MCYIRIFELCDRLLLNNKIEEENKDKLESCMYHLIENLRKIAIFP